MVYHLYHKYKVLNKLIIVYKGQEFMFNNLVKLIFKIVNFMIINP